MLLALFALSALATPPAPAPAPAPASATLCEAGVTVFSCETTNGKVVSICASPEVSRDSGWVQYRFGRPGALELVVPKTPSEDHPFRMLQFIGGPILSGYVKVHALDFRVGEVRYQVYEAWDQVGSSVHSLPERSMVGIRVGNTQGKLLAELRCTSRISGTLSELKIDWQYYEDELLR